MTTRNDYQRLLDLWRSIGQAGGISAFVQAQLRERGFVLEVEVPVNRGAQGQTLVHSEWGFRRKKGSCRKRGEEKGN